MKAVTLFFGSLSLILNTIMLCLAIIQEVSTVKQKKKTVSLLLLVFLFASNAVSFGSVGTWVWGASNSIQSSLLCLVVSYTYWLTSGINRFILMIIAVDRFLAVMNPFRYKQYMNSGKVLTLTVVYCLSIVVLPSVASEHYSNKYRYARELSFCIPESGTNGLFHGWFICDLVFPVAIIAVLYIYMIHFLGTKIHKGVKHSAQNSASLPTAPTTTHSKRRRRRRRFRKISVSNMELRTCRTSTSSADGLMLSSSLRRQGNAMSLSLTSSQSPEQTGSILPGTASLDNSLKLNSDIFELHRAPSHRINQPLSPSTNVPDKHFSKSDNSLVRKAGSGNDLLSHRDAAFSIVKRHSKSDYDIRRCSSIISGKLKSPAFDMRRLSVNGIIFNRFRSIYTIIMCCLSEILIVSLLDIMLYLLTVTNNMPVALNFHTVHVLIMHLLLTPILYSYGFAPLKKRIKKALKLQGDPNHGAHGNNEREPSVF
ncbi:hypothetical protein ACHWQZ_G001372 [Mnemiopsis leidyi]